MAEESMHESGKRLARDMRRLRESRHITVDDLHDETKIPIGLIEAFEEDALFDHPQFNQVYLRSFVRTYANVIGIDSGIAISALEEALANRYHGSLAAEYLGEDVSERKSAEEESATSDRRVEDAPHGIADERRARDDLHEKSTSRRSADSDASAGEENEARDRSPEDVKRRERLGPGAGTTGSAAAGLHGGSRPEDPMRASEEEEVSDAEEWTMQSPPRPKADSATRYGRRAADSASARTAAQTRREEPNRGWIVALVALVVVAAVVWAVVRISGGDETMGPDRASPLTDTGDAAVDAPSAPASPRSQPVQMPTLGDTMNVFVIAANDKVDPIRVTVDNDLRRPYWLELGDSMRFAPTERIVVEEQLDNIRLSIEGIDYPTNRRDDLGRIVISRDSVEAYFATGGDQNTGELEGTGGQEPGTVPNFDQNPNGAAGAGPPDNPDPGPAADQ